MSAPAFELVGPTVAIASPTWSSLSRTLVEIRIIHISAKSLRKLQRERADPVHALSETHSKFSFLLIPFLFLRKKMGLDAAAPIRKKKSRVRHSSIGLCPGEPLRQQKHSTAIVHFRGLLKHPTFCHLCNL